MCQCVHNVTSKDLVSVPIWECKPLSSSDGKHHHFSPYPWLTALFIAQGGFVDLTTTSTFSTKYIKPGKTSI